MRNAVDGILSGKFNYEKGTLEFSSLRIELSLRPDEVYTGSFTISAKPGRLAEGRVYSKDIRLELLTESFSGETSEIGYSVSTRGMEEGDVYQGEIYIISNQGEYYIPYVVSVVPENIDTSLGSIRNLFHFANLAKSNWDEAVKLFYTDEFLSIFTGNDKQYLRAYRGLSKYFGNEQNVEEFLININKKHAVEYVVERDYINLSNPDSVREEYIQITRNGWGYTFLNVRSDCDFIELNNTEITDDDFLGNFLSYAVTIDPAKLHGGCNYGSVHFFNAFTEFYVDFCVDCSDGMKDEVSKSVESKYLSSEMLILYQALRAKEISPDTYIAENKKLAERFGVLLDGKVVTGLYKAQSLINEERYNEAKWLLDKAADAIREKGLTGHAVWAFYLYLTTLCNRDENYIDSVTEEVSKIYDKNPAEWRVAWMLLYLSADYAKSPSKKWLFIEEQLERNCHSPMFYIEAMNMIRNNPALLTKLSYLEIEVLRYGAKKNLLTPDIVSQLTYLISKEKVFKPSILFLLEKCYEVDGKDETLALIAEYLIKGDKTGPEYFHWYSAAVDRNLRVTKLFEYFMMSVDLSSEVDIPKMVYMYFSYQSELDWRYTAYLYARVIHKKEEYPDIFLSYKDDIERFCIEEIEKEHMNRDLAVIYRFMLPQINLTESIATKASKLIFINRIRIKNPQITKVIIYQEHECAETIIPVVNGEAYAPIYNKDYTILFEDGLANRYMVSVEYEIEKLMVPGKIASLVLPYVKDSLELNVYACECSSEMVEIRNETKDKYRMIMNSSEIEEEYKAEIREKLMTYYYDNDDIRDLDDLLSKLDPRHMSKSERALSCKYLILRGMFDKALDWISSYGDSGMDVKDLIKLCSKLILRNEYVEEKELLRISASVFFRGKYDDILLKYLAMHYVGMTRDMRKIFNAAENFDIDLGKLCERMLIQMLYTGYFVPERVSIYQKYVQSGADMEVRMAVLAQCSFEYFVKEQLMEAAVFEEIAKVKAMGERIGDVSKLAYVKFYSEEKNLIDKEVMDNITEFINDLLEKGIYMSFFKEFVEKGSTGVDRYSDKTIIEYKSEPGARVYIHYIIEGDEDIRAEYVTEEMREMFGGVFAKSFILFFGENLQYYVTEEREGEELLTESGSVQKSDISNEATDSKFNRINDIVIAKTLQDYDTVDNLLYEYKKQEYLTHRLFKLQ